MRVSGALHGSLDRLLRAAKRPHAETETETTAIQENEKID
jgi:hypothetical protein